MRVLIILPLFVFLIMNYFIIAALASSGGVPQEAVEKSKTADSQIREKKYEPHAILPSKPLTSQGVKSKEETKSLPKTPPTLDEKTRKRIELIKNKKAFLNNSRWQIEVIPFKGGEKTQDYLIFKDLKIGVESLLEKGFSYTNYTLTLKDNGNMVVETMQTSSEGKVVFIKAEVSSDGKSLRGVMSFPEGATHKDYSFSSKIKKLIR